MCIPSDQRIRWKATTSLPSGSWFESCQTKAQNLQKPSKTSLFRSAFHHQWPMTSTWQLPSAGEPGTLQETVVKVHHYATKSEGDPINGKVWIKCPHGAQDCTCRGLFFNKKALVPMPHSGLVTSILYIALHYQSLSCTGKHENHT